FVAAASERVPGVRVTVVGAVEEESPTSKGARHRATLPAPDWCVIGEPSGWDGVTIAYKGRIGATVTLERSARHGAAPGATVSEEALALWDRIRSAAQARTAGVAGFDGLDCRLEGITGGSDGLVERAELRIGYRLPPAIASADVINELLTICASHEGDAKVRAVHSAREEPMRAARGSPLARAFVRSIAENGANGVFKKKSGTSDMNILAPAWGCPMVAYGPGDSRYDHTPMERLGLAESPRAIAVPRGVLGGAVPR